MKKQRGDGMVELIVLILFIVGYFIFGPWSCSSKWEKSGFNTDWGPIQGCLVEVEKGKWIPEERYREMDN